ncbi:MAG: hypothetical protein JXM73_22570 [Anaerolineae bacterium]|nr:hypothetical protein [Anaerolineae bacterium]
MKIRITLLFILLAFVPLGTGAGALSAPRYQVEAGILAGGGYQLTSFGPQADNVSAGGAYLLLGPSAPAGQGSGCCCTYVPCIMRNR